LPDVFIDVAAVKSDFRSMFMVSEEDLKYFHNVDHYYQADWYDVVVKNSENDEVFYETLRVPTG
jgi:hypothetical protein